MKDKNNMTISVDTEKAFDKIQCSFTIKTLNKVGIKGTDLNIHWPYMTCYHQNSEKRKTFILRSGTIQSCPLLPLLFKAIYTRSPSQRNSSRNIKDPDWKGGIYR